MLIYQHEEVADLVECELKLVFKCWRMFDAHDLQVRWIPPRRNESGLRGSNGKILHNMTLSVDSDKKVHSPKTATYIQCM